MFCSNARRNRSFLEIWDQSFVTFKQKSNNFVVNAPKNRTVHSFIVIFDFLENRFLVGYPVVGCKRLPV